MKKLFVIGIGPGAVPRLTAEAEAALAECEFVAGYPLYLELVASLCMGKERYVTAMGNEAGRCHAALSAAREGRTSALVCSGDAGVYGLAGLALELAAAYDGVEVVVVPGITAALSGAALLGSPLTNDFAVISLSDLLTPWPEIERRLSGAAAAGLVLCLYNPGSHGRSGHLLRACDIVLRHRDGAAVSGIVRNIGRTGEEARITTLSGLREETADMFTTVFIGNEATINCNGKMITRRGYACER